jgi:hypothetical protein
MSGRGTFLTGLIGFGVSVLTLFVSLALPIINGPRTSWREATIGILPSGLLVIVFLFVMFLGMFLMLSSIQRYGRRRRRAYDDDDWAEEPPPRRSRPPRYESDQPSR